MKNENYHYNTNIQNGIVVETWDDMVKPAYLRISPVNINGIRTNRLMIVLKTKGCEYARKKGGCTVCGFLNHADEHITDEEIIRQLDYALMVSDLTNVKEIDLLTLGSFLNDNEVSREARRILLSKISKLKHITRVSFESRAEYVTVEKLNICKAILEDKLIDFGIGLESADDYVRNRIIKKGLSRKGFENVIKKLKQANCDLLVYLLIKPPHLSEKMAIEDAVKSVEYIFDTAKKYTVAVRAAFEPVFICRNTPLEDLFLNSKYRLVNLWSVVEIIKRIHQRGNIYVGLSDENLSYDRMPNSCEKCYRSLVDEIEGFNRTQDISRLEKLDCPCKKDYLHKMETGVI